MFILARFHTVQLQSRSKCSTKGH